VAERGTAIEYELRGHCVELRPEIALRFRQDIEAWLERRSHGYRQPKLFPLVEVLVGGSFVLPLILFSF
jgi:hypothetical protein